MNVAGGDATGFELRPRRHVDGSFALTVKLTQDLSEGHGWKAIVVVEGARPLTTLVLRIGPGEPRTVEVEIDRERTLAWPEEPAFKVLVVEGSGCECEASSTTIEAYDYPPEVVAYPGPETLQ